MKEMTMQSAQAGMESPRKSAALACFKQPVRQFLLLVTALLACGATACAQLPNEKFGKPSAMEWDFVGWGEAVNASAIILCKTLTATYQLADQVSSNNQFTDVNFESLSDFGKNEIDDSNILVNYEVRLRTKILKPEGAGRANIDITYFDANDGKVYNSDVVSDMKVTVFTKNEKGKVERRKVKADAFAKERIDDNYMVLHVVVPDVEPGSIIEYQYNVTSPRPTFLYDWVFQECIPTVRSKCDIDIPAFLQFDMNVPINKLVKSGVEVGRVTYDTNRPDMKKGKSCPTNHYKIVGDYILPESQAAEEIAAFTSRIKNQKSVPAAMPAGSTHLRLR